MIIHTHLSLHMLVPELAFGLERGDETKGSCLVEGGFVLWKLFSLLVFFTGSDSFAEAGFIDFYGSLKFPIFCWLHYSCSNSLLSLDS